MPLLESFTAHAWTVLPTVLHRIAPRNPPATRAWSTRLRDPVVGPITLSGSLREHAESDTCLLVVHGLGGAAEAHYCIAAAHAAEHYGVSCLRLCLRGADLQGEDFYHAGLTDDLSAALQSPELARYQRLYVLGYSLGGHLALCFGLSRAPRDPRVRAVAAVCAPLDLSSTATALDRTRSWVYRRHVLSGLKRGYMAVALKRPVPTPPVEVAAARTIREWDALTVVPRYGFGSVERYYASMSVGPRLHELSIPALLVQVDADPMVPPWTYQTYLHHPPRALTVHRLNVGGHVGFPARVALGNTSPSLLERQIVHWLLQR